mgnify:CR=1 FL=1
MNKKGQEEMVGFVMIVVLVAIVFVILLGILVNRTGGDGIEQESRDVYQYLESVMEYTTDCAISFEPAYSEVRDLVGECYDNPGGDCTSGENVCVALNRTLKNLFESSWNVGENSSYKGYIFEVVYVNNDRESSELVIKEGTCEGNFVGAEILVPSYPGTLINSFSLCS